LAKQLAPRLAEHAHKMILDILEDRFGPVPAEVVTTLRAITDDDRLRVLNRLAARCPDLAAFRQELAP